MSHFSLGTGLSLRLTIHRYWDRGRQLTGISREVWKLRGRLTQERGLKMSCNALINRRFCSLVPMVSLMK